MSTHSQPLPSPPAQEREGLLVDHGFQVRALLPLIIFAGLYALLLLGALFIRVHPLYVGLYPHAEAEPDPGIRAILLAQLWNINIDVWVLLGVAGLVAAYYGLHWSLRAARPVYRLHYALKEMTEGEYKPIRFRPGEEFRFFEDDLAALSQKIKLIGTRNRDILMAVHSQVRKLADRLAADEIIARADLEEFTRAVLAQLEKAPEVGVTARR